MISLLAVTFLLAAANQPAPCKPNVSSRKATSCWSSERFEQALLVYRAGHPARSRDDDGALRPGPGAHGAQAVSRRDHLLQATPATPSTCGPPRTRTSRFDNERARQDRIQALHDRIRQNQERAVHAGIPPRSASATWSIQHSEIQIQHLQRAEGEVGGAPPLPPGLSLALGSAYFRSGKLEDAEREYRAAIETSRSSASRATTSPWSCSSPAAPPRPGAAARRPRRTASRSPPG